MTSANNNSNNNKDNKPEYNNVYYNNHEDHLCLSSDSDHTPTLPNHLIINY